MILCAVQALLFQQLCQSFLNFSGKHWGPNPIYSKFMFEPSMHIILHVWLLRKCNDCKNVEFLQTWGMFAKLRNRSQHANCNVICKSEVSQSNSQKKNSTAESSSLHIPHGVSTGTPFTVSCWWCWNNQEIDVKLQNCSQYATCNVICESSMLVKSMWNCEIASNSKILFSTAKSSSLRVFKLVGAGKTFTVSGRWYRNNSCPPVQSSLGFLAQHKSRCATLYLLRT